MRQIQEKKQAINFRREGMTYGEIRKALGPIPKGTLNGWFKNIELTQIQQNAIKERVKDCVALGREKAGWANHQKRLKRLSLIKKEAIREWPQISESPVFLAGLMLYLAEGSKKYERFQFMNSDPNLVKFMLKWIDNVAHLPKEKISARLYVHKIYRKENLEDFWKKFLSLDSSQFRSTVYKPTIHKIKKNDDYKGCLRIETSGSELFWKIKTWQECFFNNL